MEQLFLTKYKISTGECFEPNYYDAIPESDGIHAYTEDLPTENYIKKHYMKDTGFTLQIKPFLDSITKETESRFLELINSLGI